MSDTKLFRIPGIDCLIPVAALTSDRKSEFQVVYKKMGGKYARTEVMKMLSGLAGEKAGPGSAPGKICYLPLSDDEAAPIRDILIVKLRIALSILEAQEVRR